MSACGICLSDLVEAKQKRYALFDILTLFLKQVLLVTCVEWIATWIRFLDWVGVEFGLGWRCWHD
jgi:hypothetical protein